MIQANTTSTSASQRFHVRWVFGGVTEAMRQQLIAFWLQEGALANPMRPGDDHGKSRVYFRKKRKITSLALFATAAIRMDEHHRSYGFVRIFIRPDSRLVGLNVCLMKRMIEGFTTLAREPGAPHRLVATIENRKLERRAAQRILARLGFVHVGTAPNGELAVQCA